MGWNTDRQQYIAGLRELADLLETQDLPVPTHGDVKWLLFGGTDYEQQKSMAAVIVRRIAGSFNKDLKGDLFAFETLLGGDEGLGVEVVVNRDSVCERVVTGTREVTKTVPDPSVNVPLVEVTETVEDVEWQCMPLLADREAVSA